MTNKKPVLITIIVLLAIFAPLTVASYFLKEEKNPFDKNPHHDFYYKNKLWFYDKDNNLLNTYECTTSTCDYANTTNIDDEEYGVNYYKDGTLLKTNLINDDYAFITDGALIKLFSTKQGNVLQSYKSFKNYNANIAGDKYILQNQNDLWGVVSISNIIMSVLPFDYNFVGLKNSVEDGLLNAQIFIVLKDDKWYLIDEHNSSISAVFEEPIIDYNNTYIITKENEKIRVYDYSGGEYLTDTNISNCLTTDSYIGIISQNVLYVYGNLDNNYIGSVSLTGNETNLKMEIDNNGLVIKNGDDVLDTIALI